MILTCPFVQILLSKIGWMCSIVTGGFSLSAPLLFNTSILRTAYFTCSLNGLEERTILVLDAARVSTSSKSGSFTGTYGLVAGSWQTFRLINRAGTIINLFHGCYMRGM